ncbi:hypothetical protein ACH4OY_32230 [Micromonospora rubida]|uniref:RNase H type-1 domain-containing protein n=1 Tax=Micromonospora rubida TaxID=2697657 RepID=A0ABW7SUA0_9ACTN
MPVGDQWEHPAELREKFSGTVCEEPTPSREPKPRELVYGRGKTVSKDKHAVQGRIDGYEAPDETMITIWCGGSQEFNPSGPPWRPTSWAYVADNGQWALGTATQGLGVVGDNAVGSVLRAVFWALEQLPDSNPITVVTDASEALELTEKWRAGNLEMPRGYTTERTSGNEAKMMRLARQFADDPDWLSARRLRKVEHPLQQAADRLAQITRLWVTGEIAKEQAQTHGEHAARDALSQRAVTEIASLSGRKRTCRACLR